MKVLVACEESQVVTKAFRSLGHEAYSCDLQFFSGGHPEWHILGDCVPLLNGFCEFSTCDGVLHVLRSRWDMIIAFPPCTYLTNAGAVRLFDSQHRIKDIDRYTYGLEAASFFNCILSSDCSRIAVENPVPLSIFNLPRYSQIVEPYYFGDPWKKRTCLWLKGLPLLKPTNIVAPEGLWVGATSSRRDSKVHSRYRLSSHRDSCTRAKTFPGVAFAMADQWGFCCEVTYDPEN